jgi:CheY-like chemotaxis protein
VDILRDKIIVVAAAEALVRAALEAEFTSHGSRVLPVTGAIEAYEIARVRQVDAVLCACQLSSGEVRLLVSDIRRFNHDAPVILFGAAGEKITQTEALHFGFAAFFAETFPTAPLAEAAARNLEFVEERKKKKVERVTVAAQVDLTFGSPPQSVQLKAPVLNLSRGGMFLSMERLFPPLNAEVRFALALPPYVPHPAIEGRALVRWVRDRPATGHLPGVGLEFLEVSPEAQAFLDAYVLRVSTRSKP